MAKRTPLETAKATAVAFYRAEEKKNPSGYPYSPADATRAASKASGIPFSRLVPVVAAVRAFAKIGGVSETASYTGRGTRAGATATRTSETAEVVA